MPKISSEALHPNPGSYGEVPMMLPKENPRPKTSNEVIREIKELLQQQRFAVRRAAAIGMSRDEAESMEARINQIGDLLGQLSDPSR